MPPASVRRVPRRAAPRTAFPASPQRVRAELPEARSGPARLMRAPRWPVAGLTAGAAVDRPTRARKKPAAAGRARIPGRQSIAALVAELVRRGPIPTAGRRAATRSHAATARAPLAAAASGAVAPAARTALARTPGAAAPTARPSAAAAAPAHAPTAGAAPARTPTARTPTARTAAAAGPGLC